MLVAQSASRTVPRASAHPSAAASSWVAVLSDPERTVAPASCHGIAPAAGRARVYTVAGTGDAVEVTPTTAASRISSRWSPGASQPWLPRRMNEVGRFWSVGRRPCNRACMTTRGRMITIWPIVRGYSKEIHLHSWIVLEPVEPVEPVMSRRRFSMTMLSSMDEDGQRQYIRRSVITETLWRSLGLRWRTESGPEWPYGASRAFASRFPWKSATGCPRGRPAGYPT